MLSVLPLKIPFFDYHFQRPVLFDNFVICIIDEINGGF